MVTKILNAPKYLSFGALNRGNCFIFDDPSPERRFIKFSNIVAGTAYHISTVSGIVQIRSDDNSCCAFLVTKKEVDKEDTLYIEILNISTLTTYKFSFKESENLKNNDCKNIMDYPYLKKVHLLEHDGNSKIFDVCYPRDLKCGDKFMTFPIDQSSSIYTCFDDGLAGNNFYRCIRFVSQSLNIGEFNVPAAEPTTCDEMPIARLLNYSDSEITFEIEDRK